jgi:cell wall-associated NlpC family hydrolase
MRSAIPRSLLALGLAASLAACASSPTPGTPRAPHAARAQRTADAPAQPAAPGRDAVRTALSMLGTPYRYGGNAPSGFDCSGLVNYSYAQAGVTGLPRTAAALEASAQPIELDELRPGDLLFFQLSGRKTSHVALYVGDESFVHAPSSGGRVERVDFDHVYWGPRIRRAGRIAY